MRIWLLALLVACGGSPQAASMPPSNGCGPNGCAVVQAAPPAVAAPKMPKCADDTDLKCLLSQMDFFRTRMCSCTHKICADTVNDDMTKWGTELAKSSSTMLRSQKPDPDDAKRSADIMTKYTECMVKVMTDGDPIPQPIPDPCGGDPNPCGD